jgi:hypothetical protein
LILRVLERRIATLTADVEKARASGESDEWINAQLEETKERLARVEEQFKDWEVGCLCSFISSGRPRPD